MNICFLAKYPPIQGGVSTSNYWLAKALGGLGHKIFIVTNAEECEPEYREEIFPKDAHFLEPKNVKVFYTYLLNRRFIPYYNPFIAKLAGLAIDVVKKEKIDVLYSNYLMPYGIAASLVRGATGVPLFLDHAGSDITNLFDEPLLQPAFVETFKSADLVVNSYQVRERLVNPGHISEDKLSPFITKMFYAGVLAANFSPRTKPYNLSKCFSKMNKPVFTYFGKISPLKKTFAFIKAASLLPEGSFYLLFVVERGRMHIQLKNQLRKYGLLNYTCILPFQPPWRIPSLINASTCIVAPESEEEPYLPSGTHGSKISFEAMLCGKCAIIGEGMSKKGFYTGAKDKKHFLSVNPNNIKEFSKTLRFVIDNPAEINAIGRQAYSYANKYRNADAVKLFVKNFYYTILNKK